MFDDFVSAGVSIMMGLTWLGFLMYVFPGFFKFLFAIIATWAVLKIVALILE